MKIESNAISVGAVPAQAKAKASLREDFRKALEERLDGWLGKPGTERRAKIESTVSALLSEPSADGRRTLDLDRISDEKKTELMKLQKASQDFEAIFVKGLLAQMRRSSFAEEPTPMAEIAKDMMDQAVAESVSRSGNSIGIAKTVFLDMAQRIVKSQ